MDLLKQNVSNLFTHKPKVKGNKDITKSQSTAGQVAKCNKRMRTKRAFEAPAGSLLRDAMRGSYAKLMDIVELQRDVSEDTCDAVLQSSKKGRFISKKEHFLEANTETVNSQENNVDPTLKSQMGAMLVQTNNAHEITHLQQPIEFLDTKCEQDLDCVPFTPPRSTFGTDTSFDGWSENSAKSECDHSQWIISIPSTTGSIPTEMSGTIKVPQTSKPSRRLSLSAGFELPRFRKRQHDKENGDDDNVSVQSLDVSGVTSKKKSKRSLMRVSASLVNLISSNRHKNNDSEGFKVPRSPLSQNASPYKPPKPSPAKRRSQLTWVDWVAGGKSNSILPHLSHTDIKRQEAIYELYQGEKDMLEDLINVTKMYRDSLVTLGLMIPADVSILFGNIDSLIPVHEDLLSRLQGQRKPDGTTQNVGKQIHEWASSLNVYVKYCANQIKAKSIFDEKKNEPPVDDFLQRCIASPFSRKLDLWTLLDGARGRFVKYPLLVRSILKYTHCDSGDAAHLERSIKLIEKIIREADEQTGIARCEYSKSTLVYLFDEQKVPEIDESTALVCSGCMKSTKGSKLYIFLFDKVAVISRATTQSGRQMYQIYRQPIPATELVVEDLPDGEVKMGSFRSAFGQGGQTAKNLIRLSFQDTDRGQSHTLIISDEHDKRQWMQAFNKVASKILIVVNENKTKEKTAQ